MPVRIGGGQLTLSLPDGQTRSVPLTRVSLRRAGFNELNWQFEWTDTEGCWSLALSDAGVQRELSSQSPPGLEAQLAELGSAGRRHAVRRGIGWGLLAGWLLAPLLLIAALVWQAETISAWIAARVPIEREVQLGEQLFAGEKPGLQLVEDSRANRAIETIGAKLTAGSRYRYRWYLARDPALNAHALPGGIIVVNTGLVDAADSAEELAGVLAHEVQHIELRHSLKAMAQQLGVTAAAAIAIGDFSSAAKIAAHLSQLRFSRQQETAADAAGLRALRSAAIDPGGMPAIFDKLERAGDGVALSWLSTHPATAERITTIRAAIASAPATRVAPLPIDWTAVRASVGERSGSSPAD